MLTKEELKNKYIKYDSSITEEVFNKILERAKEFQNKICKELRPYDAFKNTFDRFQSNGFFWFGPIGHFSYGVDNNSQDAEEIKVSDILGEETKFEVGKWYSFYWNWSSRYNCIGKVCQVGGHVRTAIHFNNYTSNNSPGKLFTDERVIYLAEIENIKELSLEEIQQYLPDGHPDKIVKPIEEWSVDSYVVFLQKYGRSNKGTIDVIKEFDYISIVSYLEKEGGSPGYLDRELNNYLKWFATLSEAEAFSKSLLKSDENKPKFKIGDWVVVIPSNNDFPNYKNAIGHIFPIRDDGAYYQNFIKGGQEAIDPNNTYGINYTLEDVRLATSEEIAKVTKPKTKPFEFNKWYKSNNADGLFFIQSKSTGYGFRSNHVNYWFTNNGDFEWNRDGLELATSSEVKERLLSYAKEKYPIGTKFKCMAYDKEFTVTNPNYMDNANGFKPNDDSTIWIEVKEQCSGKIFDGKGKWAEVISKPESKVNRNVYYEVETQEEYNEILDWLESNGEQVNECYDVIDPLKYICFEDGEWGLNTKVESQLSKAEFQFKGKSKKQPIKTGPGLREQILRNPYLFDSVSFRWDVQSHSSTQNSITELKQKSTKLLSFEEDDVVLFKTNSVKISNEQLIIND